MAMGVCYHCRRCPTGLSQRDDYDDRFTTASAPGRAPFAAAAAGQTDF
jgi:hypothetical protein